MSDKVVTKAGLEMQATEDKNKWKKYFRVKDN